MRANQLTFVISYLFILYAVERVKAHALHAAVIMKVAGSRVAGAQVFATLS